MAAPYSCFIFDLDGTLAYTLEDLRSSMNEMLRYYGFGEVSLDDVLRNINFGSHAFVRGCLPEERRGDDAFVEEAHTVYSGFYAKGYLRTTHLYPRVAEGIAYLKAHGARLAVFSNKQHDQTRDIVSRLFPAGTFEYAIGHDGTFPCKPAPDGALFLAERFGVAPEKVAFVGDSDVDMKVAANAGMVPIGVSWGYRPQELLLTLGAETILTNADDFKKLI